MEPGFHSSAPSLPCIKPEASSILPLLGSWECFQARAVGEPYFVTVSYTGQGPCRDHRPLSLLSRGARKSGCPASLETSVLKVLWQGPWKGTAGREIKEIHTECMCVWRVWCFWQRQTWDGDAPPRKDANAIWHSVFSQPARPCLHARVGCMQMPS